MLYSKSVVRLKSIKSEGPVFIISDEIDICHLRFYKLYKTFGAQTSKVRRSLMIECLHVGYVYSSLPVNIQRLLYM